MPKKTWTKLDVQKRLVKVRSRLASLDKLLLDGDFPDNQYRYLVEFYEGKLYHLRNDIRYMRKLLKADPKLPCERK